ncbi:hypothetical protein EV128_11385 [Rhizobium azibense]|nr:hypothetical protein EV128_11385 [Rhizobium azibense]
MLGKMIRRLHEHLEVPTDTLIVPIRTNNAAQDINTTSFSSKPPSLRG